MAVTINGDGTISGVSVGGLPDGVVDSGTLATNSVDSAELIDGAVDSGHLASGVGGGWQLITTATASNDTEIDFDGNFSTDYDYYQIRFRQLIPATNTASIRARILIASSAKTDSNYDWSLVQVASNASTSNHSVGQAFAYVDIAPGAGNQTGEGHSGIIDIIDPLDTANYKVAHWLGQAGGTSAGYLITANRGCMRYRSASAWSGFRIYMSGGNLTSGEFELYGLGK